MTTIPTVKAVSGLRLTLRRINAIFRPIDFIEQRTRQYGDFYQIKFKDSSTTVMTSNPQAIEDILTASSDRFEVGRGNQILAFLVGNNSLLLLGCELDSLETSYDYQVITNLPYLNAAIAETLRIYPIAVGTFGRILTQSMSVMGYNFEPNTWLMFSIYALHHRENLYPNADQFKPERFLNRQFSPYEYIPFGGGNRRCIGSALASLEMKLVTVTILQHFHLKLINQRQIFPVRRGLTLAPPAGFKMKVISH